MHLNVQIHLGCNNNAIATASYIGYKQLESLFIKKVFATECSA